VPAWAPKTKELPDFSEETLGHWAPLVREMIRDQIPDFHLRSEWSNQRNSCKARRRDTKGEIQNAILDDIASALKTIAPKKAGSRC
jgi:hypothetical protein